MAVVTAIWQNPAKVFGCEFKQSGQYQANRKGGEYDEAGKIRICMNTQRTNILVFYNGGSRTERCDVFTYLDEYVLHAGGYYPTLKQCADVYGVKLQFSEQERKKIAREALAREVAASLIESLRLNPEGATAKFIREKRKLMPDGVHFGELTEESIKRAKDSLKQRGISYSEDDFNDLFMPAGSNPEKRHTAEAVAKWGLSCVIPYYCNGVVRGFVLRNINNTSEMRYIYGVEGRNGYCDRLTNGEPATIVEGQMDAIRLIQAGVKNVIAMGGASASDDIIQLLYSRNITQVTYIPDHELDKNTGTKRTNLIDNVISKLLAAKVDGDSVVKNLYICELPLPEGKTKIDADEYGKMYGNATLVEHLDGNAVAWWAYKLDELVSTATASRDDVNVSWFQNEFDKVYNSCGNAYERQRIKDYIKGRAEYSAFGVTPEALSDKDEWSRGREYQNRVKAASADLNAAIEKGANPATIAEIVARLQEAQSNNAREEWDKQLNQTFEDELKAIADQPDTVPTRWELGTIGKDKEYHYREKIEYYPADLSVFCASTSHGKTMFLMQSALHTVNDTGKTVLYISCEESKRQLLERALNVYLDIDISKTAEPYEPGKQFKDSPKDKNGHICFRRKTRKKAIKAALKGADICAGYSGYMGVSDDFKALKTRIMQGVEQYKRTVRPRLVIIHTDGTAESLAANAARVVEQIRTQGGEVAAVFVDYVQLLYSENKTYSRTDELKDVCSALKSCAEHLELPVIVGAQLNRNAVKEGIDSVTVANLGESTDIERIAHDLYLIWQVDRTTEGMYFANPTAGSNEERNWGKNAGERAKRIFTSSVMRPSIHELKRGYMYVEQLKARDGQSGGWGLFPFEGERGAIGTIDRAKMKE